MWVKAGVVVGRDIFFRIEWGAFEKVGRGVVLFEVEEGWEQQYGVIAKGWRVNRLLLYLDAEKSRDARVWEKSMLMIWRQRLTEF